MNRYNFKVVESKWQEFWQKNKSFKSEKNKSKKKFYCLEMFPYPSGKIHMGHVRNYTIGDVLSRQKSMQGFNVLHPMGWDSFGMPAENAAKENKLDPKIWTEKNISVMKNQLKKLGLSIDWDREISTCSEEYYKHQQLFFLELYEKGLVYRKENYVNWDPVDETVLANEQVIDGKGWRSGASIEQKYLSQWFLKTSSYSEELLTDLEKLDNWPTKVKLMQANWIGKSVGVEIKFSILNPDNLSTKSIDVFTTRQDTIFGATFCAISLNHPLSKELALKDKNVKVTTGSKGIIEVASYPSDLTVIAIVGYAGLKPTIESIRHGKTIALANKECLVVAGEYINDCLTAGLVYRREFYQDNDVGNKDSLMFVITFKPIFIIGYMRMFFSIYLNSILIKY